MSEKTLKDPEGGNSPSPISTKFCVACHESIHAKANKCHFCGTDQQPKRLHSMAQVLKWIGGISAVISLVIGASRVNDLFSEWQERKIAVSQLVNAATLQIDSSDYKGAWALIDEALSFNPSSQLARQQRIAIAMAWVRDMRTYRNETFSDIIDKLLPTLYQGSVNEDPDIAANALTHIGWANYLRSRDGIVGLEIEKYYECALKLDPDNTYAHVMWAYWMLWPRNQKRNQDTDLAIANSHFSAALLTGNDYEYVKELQVSALINAVHDTKVQFELIKVAEEIRKSNGMLSPDNRYEVYRVILGIVAPDNLLDQSTQPIFNQLTNIFSPLTLLKLSEWLDTENKNTGPDQMMTHARLEELVGNREKALSFYHLLATSTGRARSSYKEFSKQAIERLSSIN
jgi:tetratricopeptide (TPR) repeat protein